MCGRRVEGVKRAEEKVPPDLDGRRLDAAVRALFALSWGAARARIATGKVSVDGTPRTDPSESVREGMTLGLRMNAPRPRPEALPDSAIVHVDAQVVVVDKPAGVSTVPYGTGDEEGTLDDLVRTWLSRHGARADKKGSPRPPLGVVHRLDKETSGLLVFTRTWLAKTSLSSQFRAHTVLRRYLAIAHGTVRPGTIRSYLVADRGDGLRGSRPDRREGQLAVTHIEVREPLEGATLIECRLETGRTHQVRIHLAESGHPLVGERVYVRGYDGPLLAAPRLMLHAAELGFVHPATQEEMRWTLPPPADFAAVVGRLRRRRDLAARGR